MRLLIWIRHRTNNSASFEAHDRHTQTHKTLSRTVCPHRPAQAHRGPPEQSQLVPSAPQLQFITRKLAPSAGRLDRAATHGAELLHAVRYPASRAASPSEELASFCSRSRAARGFRSRAARYSDDPDGRRRQFAHIVEGAHAAWCLAPLVARGSDGAGCARRSAPFAQWRARRAWWASIWATESTRHACQCWHRAAARRPRATATHQMCARAARPTLAVTP